MVKRELKRQFFSLYYKGEFVLVRIFILKKFVKGKKISLKSNCEGRIIEVDYNFYKYNIEFNDLIIDKNKKVWFKVDDVISLIKEEENKR